MSGWIAGAGLAGSALATAGTLYSASKARDQGYGQLFQAQQNYMLQKQMAAQQERMSEAGRTDAAGDETYFNGKDWVVKPTDATKGIISASQLNERENQVKGGYRREIGQSNNFRERGNVGNESQSVLRLLRDRVGAPTKEGVESGGAVAEATRVGGNRGRLVDAIARNLIHQGSSGAGPEAALREVDATSGDDLRTALTKNSETAPERFRVAEDGWNVGRLNKFNPLNAVASNITDAPFAPTTVGAPINAAMNQAATYGAATSGRGATGVNAASLGINSVNQPDMPYGPAITGLTNSVLAYLRSRKKNDGYDDGSKNGSGL